MIQDIIRKLRRTADLLEDMWLSGDPASAPKAARAIEKRIGWNFAKSAALAAAAPAVVAAPPADTRKRKYAPGSHWMQRPENKERVRKMAQARARSRRRNATQRNQHTPK